MSRSDIPQHVLESLARHFLPQIIEFYQDENNVKEYEEWKKNKQSESKGDKNG